MKLAIEIAEQALEAEFTLTNGGTVQFKHNEQIHTAQVSQPEPGLFIVTLNHHVYRCSLDQQPDGSTQITVNGQRFSVTVRDKKRRRSNASDAASSGKVTLVAPMPGKIVRVLCATGDEIGANQGVLVVEAMKMQNEVQTPKAGKVVEIRVSEGQTVNAGEVLAVIE